ncbi:TonB-dependent receptor [Ideonella azotifigens]|nr:TonB-dependent receptor [Ideonella azotifigens]MCD2342329.1 TonB-dependent receptor [Ideonella azotifigens]
MSSKPTFIPRLSPLCLALAAALAPAQALRAQEASPAPGEAGKLATVTVTAERRAESVMTVPMAVSTLRGETLDVLNSSGEDLRMLSGRVPSLNIESSFGRAFPRFYIRGYGNTDFRLNASQPVSLVLDDVVQENPILKGFPIFDVEGVEVLAGPQGTLFGRNTPAGVVKIDSVKPQKGFGGYGSISYGTYGTVNLEGAVNAPLSDQWQSRFSVQVQHRDDWVTNEAPAELQQTHKLEGYDDRAARAQFLYGAGTPFTALFNVHARDLNGSARLFRANIIQKGSNDLVDDFDIKKVYLDGKNEQKLTSIGANAHLTWALDGVKLHSITGLETVHSYSRGDVDGGYGASFLPSSGPGLILFPSETADGLSGHRQFSEELRLESTKPGPLSWQAGLYFFRETFRMTSYNYDSTAGGAFTSSSPTTQSNNAYAAFGSVNYALAPDLSLRAGLRYTHDKKKLSTDPGTVPNFDVSEGLSDEVSSSKVTGDVALSWAMDKNTNLYGRVATGVRGASILPASGFNPMSKAEPETSTSYEVGVKSELFDRRARVTADVFHYDVKHQQLTVVGGNANSTVLESAKKAMGQGVEFTLDAYLSENLLLGLSGSVNVTKIKDKDLVVGGCAQCTPTDPSTEVTLPDGSKKTVYFIDGNPLPQAPKYVANANLRYSIPTASGEFYAYTDWTYRSKVNFFLYESPEFTGKPLTTGGLRLGYIWDNGKYELAAFGRNITNRVVVNGAIDFNNLTGFVNEPRTWGAQFKAMF